MTELPKTVNDSVLGNAWFKRFYSLAVDSLGYSKAADEEARDELSSLLAGKKKVPPFDDFLEELRRRFAKRDTIVFGAGPSLREDIQKLYPVARKARILIIAADGAADALTDASIIPQIVVSDLDSCSEEALRSQSESRALFVHAHGDNRASLKELMPSMGSRILGTTQVSSIENVRNLGGLTDGDRACYVASIFDPELVVIAGMDFGTIEGEYSRSKRGISTDIDSDPPNPSKRQLKMKLGKESLEFLIQRKEGTRFVNVTSHGQRVEGTTEEPLGDLMKALS